MKQSVADARARGRSTAEVELTGEPDPQMSLAEVARTVAVLLLDARRPAAAITSIRTLETWNVFTEVRRAPGEAGRLPGPCTFRPPANLGLEVTDFAIPLISTGSLMVDGVTVRATSPESATQFVRGQRYLVFARQCEPGVGRLALSRGVFPVDSLGRLIDVSPSGPQARRPYFAEVLRLGTVDRVFEAVAQSRMK